LLFWGYVYINSDAIFIKKKTQASTKCDEIMRGTGPHTTLSMARLKRRTLDKNVGDVE